MGSQDPDRVSGPTRGVRVERRAPEAVDRPADDAQLETVPAEPLFEVLTEAPNGHRSVLRVNAKDKAAAKKAVDVPEGVRVLEAAEAPSGLGSG
jgi:hypothetical protein